MCSLIKTFLFNSSETNQSILEEHIKISTKFTLKLDKLLSTLLKKAHGASINHCSMFNINTELFPIKGLFSSDTSTLSF